MRHILFGLPPLIIFMASAMEFIIEIAKRQSRVIKLAVLAMMGGLISLQALHLYIMHPYQYVSFNRLAGAPETVPNKYETEYWFTSSKHMLEALPDIIMTLDQPISRSGPIKVRISGPLNAARPFVPEGFMLVDTFAEADFYVSNTTFRSDLLAEGEVVYEIERGGIPIGVIKRL
jgi:hypothetical protein